VSSYRASLAGLLLLGCTATSTELPPTEDDGRFGVTGSITTDVGAPVVDVFVTVSTEFCIPDRTARDGAFAIGDVDPGPKRLITYGETASNGLFASVSMAFDADDEHVFDAPIHTPELVERIAVEPSEPVSIITADGLSISMEAGALELAPFAPAELQVARVDPATAPIGVPGVELLDMFVLHPIQSTMDPPAAVSFPAVSLPEGTPVVFHALDYDTGRLEVVSSGQIDAAGRPTTTPGEGIPELTWVAVSLEP